MTKFTKLRSACRKFVIVFTLNCCHTDKTVSIKIEQAQLFFLFRITLHRRVKFKSRTIAAKIVRALKKEGMASTLNTLCFRGGGGKESTNVDRHG